MKWVCLCFPNGKWGFGSLFLVRMKILERVRIGFLVCWHLWSLLNWLHDSGVFFFFFIPNIPEKLRFRFVGWIVISFRGASQIFFSLWFYWFFWRGIVGSMAMPFHSLKYPSDILGNVHKHRILPVPTSAWPCMATPSVLSQRAKCLVLLILHLLMLKFSYL